MKETLGVQFWSWGDAQVRKDQTIESWSMLSFCFLPATTLYFRLNSAEIKTLKSVPNAIETEDVTPLNQIKVFMEKDSDNHPEEPVYWKQISLVNLTTDRHFCLGEKQMTNKVLLNSTLVCPFLIPLKRMRNYKLNCCYYENWLWRLSILLRPMS